MRNTSTPSPEKRTYTVLKVYAIVSGRYEKHLHSSLEKRTYTVLKVYAIVSGRYEKHLHSISRKKNIHSAQGLCYS